MSEIGETFAALKDLRKEHKAADPKCVKCGAQLGITRFAEGVTVCIKCDTDVGGFRDWYNGQKYSGERLAFNAWNAGRKDAAAEIIQFIVDQGTIECGKDDPYFVVQEDLVILREKFGLET